MPINLRTHGHGQGYLDLNHLIPELVATTSYRKGPYSVDVRDFSSAGTVSFDYFHRLEENVLKVSVGGHEYYEALIAASADAGNGMFTGGLDVIRNSGGWDLDENLEQTKIYVAHPAHLGSAEFRLAFSGYVGDWNSSDQVPERAIRNGSISPLGFIDPDLGGSIRRFELSGSLDYAGWRALAYAIDYDFELFSNFTYFLNNPVDGDQFEQVDNRTVYGLRVDGDQEIQ